jgi:hypothetical protein
LAWLGLARKLLYSLYMKLKKLAEEIGANILNNGKCSGTEINRVYAGDKMSDLLNKASHTTLIVTHLINPQLLRFAEIMEVPGICLLNGVVLESELVEAVMKHGTTFIVSPYGMSETCERLYQCLYGNNTSE